MTRIVYSSERRTDMSQQLGSAHYSYVFVEEAMVAALEAAGVQCIYLPHPEILKTRIAFQTILGCDPNEVIHISFRSAENLRVVSRAYNIAKFAWEFDAIKTHTK